MLGDGWEPNSTLSHTLADLAGPPRLLLGLVCQAAGKEVHIDTQVEFDVVQRTLNEYGSPSGHKLGEHRAAQIDWLEKIFSGFDKLNMGVVATTLRSLLPGELLRLCVMMSRISRLGF